MRSGIYRVDFKSGRPAGDGIAVIGFPGVMEPNPELGIMSNCYRNPWFDSPLEPWFDKTWRPGKIEIEP